MDFVILDNDGLAITDAVYPTRMHIEHSSDGEVIRSTA
jgi:hypothetical protein